MACTTSLDVLRICQDKGASGLQTFGYFANKSDFTATVAVDGSVSALTFVSGSNLYKLESAKNTNDAGYEIQISDGQNVSYKFQVNVQAGGSNQAQLNAINELLKADDLVFIMPTINKTIFIYGLSGGLSIESGTQTSGKTGSDNSLHQLLFSGEDNTIFPEFLDVDYDTSITTLTGYLDTVP